MSAVNDFRLFLRSFAIFFSKVIEDYREINNFANVDKIREIFNSNKGRLEEVQKFLDAMPNDSEHLQRVKASWQELKDRVKLLEDVNSEVEINQINQQLRILELFVEIYAVSKHCTIKIENRFNSAFCYLEYCGKPLPKPNPVQPIPLSQPVQQPEPVQQSVVEPRGLPHNPVWPH